MAGQNSYVFRRSRTLTGSVAPSVTASAEGLGQLKTDRLKLHELRAHRKQIVRGLFMVLLICGAIGIMVASFVYKPQLVEAQPGNPADANTYMETVYKYFNSHPLERFGFLMNTQGLEQAMMADHPELGGVAVEREWYGGNAKLSLFFRTPLLGWRVGGAQFYVDGDGQSFSYNHFAEPAVNVIDKSGIPTDDTGVVASSRFIRFLGRLVGALNGYKQGQVKEVIIPASTREVDIRLAGRAYLIRTNSDRDPLQQAEDIVFALNYLDKRGLSPHYVDARVAHKAFFK